MSETIMQRFRRVYPDHYIRILECIRADHKHNRLDVEVLARYLTSPADPLAAELGAAFFWERTEEGHAFWAELSKREGGEYA
jgi:hypothetical protein